MQNTFAVVLLTLSLLRVLTLDVRGVRVAVSFFRTLVRATADTATSESEEKHCNGGQDDGPPL